MDPTATTPSMIALSTTLFRFPLPATKLLNVSDCFALNLGNEGTKQSLFQLDQARKDMAHEMAAGNPNYNTVATAANRYVPMIAQVLRSLEHGKEPVYLAKPLEFEWATGIGTNPRVNWIKNQAVVWDKSMALASQALALMDHALVIVQGLGSGGNTAGKYAEGGQYLRKAAGIFDYLNAVELPRWVGQTAQSERLWETQEAVCEGLSLFCLAEAQALAIGNALSTGKTPHSLIAKLCLGAVQQLESAVVTMRNKNAVSYSTMNGDFLTHVSFMLALFKSLAHRSLGIQAWEKDEYGKAILYLQVAVREMGPCEAIATPQFHMHRNLSDHVETLKKELEALLSMYTKDNSSIYYEPVPAESDMDKPAPTFMMKAVKYEMEELRVLTFAPTEKEEKPDAAAAEAPAAVAPAAAAAPVAPAAAAPAAAPAPTPAASSGGISSFLDRFRKSSTPAAAPAAPVAAPPGAAVPPPPQGSPYMGLPSQGQHYAAHPQPYGAPPQHYAAPAPAPVQPYAAPPQQYAALPQVYSAPPQVQGPAPGAYPAQPVYPGPPPPGPQYVSPAAPQPYSGPQLGGQVPAQQPPYGSSYGGPQHPQHGSEGSAGGTFGMQHLTMQDQPR
ncbi:unnamed protein product [Chrysoparadoxa australica]